MKKNEIVLSEHELHDFIHESVRRVLINEGWMSAINPWSKENRLKRRYNNLTWQQENANKIYNVQRMEELQNTMEGVRYAIQNLQWAETQAGDNYEMVSNMTGPIITNLQKAYRNLLAQMRDFQEELRNPERNDTAADRRAYNANGMYDEYDDDGNMVGTNQRAV